MSAVFILYKTWASYRFQSMPRFEKVMVSEPLKCSIILFLRYELFLCLSSKTEIAGIPRVMCSVQSNTTLPPPVGASGQSPVCRLTESCEPQEPFPRQKKHSLPYGNFSGTENIQTATACRRKDIRFVRHV